MASRVLYSLLDVPEGDKPQSPDNRIRWLNEQQGKLMKERMDVFGHSDPTKDMEHRAVAAMVRRKAIGHHNARKNASERYLRKQIFSLKDSNKDRKSKSVAHISRNSSDLLNQNFNSKAEVQADALVAWEDCRNTCPALMSVANHHVVSSQTRSRSRVSSATQNLHDKNQALGQHGRTETRNNVDAIRGLKEDQIARTQQAVADGRVRCVSVRWTGNDLPGSRLLLTSRHASSLSSLCPPLVRLTSRHASSLSSLALHRLPIFARVH